jgi:iron complex transport system permease protein
MKGTTAKVVLLACLTAATAFVCLFVGPVAGIDWEIITVIRLPRIILAVLVGFGLAGAGTVFQGILRNPLADPFILGTSSAATAGVMAAGLLGFQNNNLAIYMMALIFALLSILVVYRIAKTKGRAPVQTIILAGVIVSLFFNALVFVFFSVFFRESQTVLFYLLGTLATGDPVKIFVSGVLILVSLAVAWLMSRELNLLTQGEEAATHLGLDVETSRKILFVAASAMVAASVAAAGMIGFVGLIVPHMIRLTLGADHKILLPASALGGALFLLIADALARGAVPPLEIPVGALTALCGSPYFIYLLRRRQSAGEF